MDVTFKNEKTCLFAERKETDQELATIHLYGYPYSLDEYVEKTGKRCENGSAQEQELLRYIMYLREDQLLRARNSQWAPEMIRLLREEPNSYFFAFGAAHFRGEHRVQKFLEDAGFNVEYVGADESLNHDPKTERGFWDWMNIVGGIYSSVILISLLIDCTKIESPENNTNGDDIRDFLRFLRKVWESEIHHLHVD